MNSILIVEDFKDVNEMLCELFTQAGYRVHTAFDGSTAYQIFQREVIDLVLLDIMLPFMTGEELLKQLRQTSDVPVIMVSAKDSVSSKIDLLRLGADDYMTKPFDLGEVQARVESALRRANKVTKARVFRYEAIELQDEFKRVTVDGREISLTAKEYGLLLLLIEHPGKVFTKANLYESVWHERYSADDDIVKTHISNLRNKLKTTNKVRDYIETIRGIGYRLK